MSDRDDLLRAARDTSAAVDTATLQTALAAYREATATTPVHTATEAPVTRRHRVVRALAATTLATKIVIGVATAAAVGGIGVAVTETVDHHPATRPPVTSAPPPSPSATPSPAGSTASSSSSPTSSSSTVTALPTTTAPSSPSPTGERSSATPTGSRSNPPESPSGPSGPSGPSPTRTPTDSPGADDRSRAPAG